MIMTIAWREFRNLTSLPATWWLLAAIQFFLAWFFLGRMEAFLQIQSELSQVANPPGATALIVAPLFNVAAMLLMVLIPVFTMRLLAEEQRNGTLVLLLCAPITETQIILGKFTGLLLLLSALILWLPVMASLLALGTRPDLGLIAANTIGLILLSSSFIALGLFISSLTSQPVVAAIAAIAVSAGLWLIGISHDSDTPWHLISPLHHFTQFNAGTLSSHHTAFFLIVTVTLLLCSILRLQRSRR